MPDGSDKQPKRDSAVELTAAQLPEERSPPGEVTFTAAEIAASRAEQAAAFRANPPAWWRAELARTQEAIEAGQIDLSDPDPGLRALVRRYQAVKVRGGAIDMVALYYAHKDDPDTYADADDAADAAPGVPATEPQSRPRVALERLLAEAEANTRQTPSEDFVPVTPQMLRDAGLIDASGADITPALPNAAERAALRRWQELRRIEHRERQLRQRKLAQVLDTMLAHAPGLAQRGRGAAAQQAALAAQRRQYERMLRATEAYVLVDVDRIAVTIDPAQTSLEAAEGGIPVAAFRELLTHVYGYPVAATGLWRKFSQARERAGLEPCVVRNRIYRPGRRAVFVARGEQRWLCNTWRQGGEIAALPVDDDQLDVQMFRRLVVHLLPHAVWDQSVVIWFLGDGLARRGEPRVTWSPYVISCPGSGKGCLSVVARVLYGRGNAAVQRGPEALSGTENHIYLRELVILEELRSRPDASRLGQAENAYDLLKHYIADVESWLQQKYVSAQSVDLFGRLMLFSNSTDAIAIPADDRRLLPLQGNQTDKLSGDIAAWAHALPDRPDSCAKLRRWLLDQHQCLGEAYGFSPFVAPVSPGGDLEQPSASAQLRETILEETLPADTFLARAVAEDMRDRQKRSVIALSEVIQQAQRRRAGPGGDPSAIRLGPRNVAEGIKLAGFFFVQRTRRSEDRRRTARKESLYASGEALARLSRAEPGKRSTVLAQLLTAEQLAEDFRES